MEFKLWNLKKKKKIDELGPNLNHEFLIKLHEYVAEWEEEKMREKSKKELLGWCCVQHVELEWHRFKIGIPNYFSSKVLPVTSYIIIKTVEYIFVIDYLIKINIKTIIYAVLDIY